jgi:tRNA(fMet)-specific endonuclease VapC
MNDILLDTDIISYFLKGDEIVVANFNKYLTSKFSFNISIISYYEIVSGLFYKNAQKQLNAFENFVLNHKLVLLSEKSSIISGRLYAELRQSGNLIDDIDLLIAGIAIEHDFTLITNNEKHFGVIPKLKLSNWKLPDA